MDWAVFIIIIVSLFALDLGVLHPQNKVMHLKESILMWLFYFTIGCLFACYVGYEHGAVKASEFISGFVVETSLSIDNLFVISIIFEFLAIPPKYQNRVLFWGIVGVIFMRAGLIAAGAVLIREMEWVLYIFGFFLVFTGVKMLTAKDHKMNMSNNRIMKFMQKHFSFTEDMEGEKFYIKRIESEGHTGTYFTPLFMALIVIQFTDLVFALDSIPAIFSITNDQFIIYTSNVFAVMGLRSLYFALTAILKTFLYLKQALALVLIFIGSKMFISEALSIKISPGLSLMITLGILAGGVLFSMYKKRANPSLRVAE